MLKFPVNILFHKASGTVPFYTNADVCRCTITGKNDNHSLHGCLFWSNPNKEDYITLRGLLLSLWMPIYKQILWSKCCLMGTVVLNQSSKAKHCLRTGMCCLGGVVLSGPCFRTLSSSTPEFSQHRDMARGGREGSVLSLLCHPFIAHQCPPSLPCPRL